MSNDTEIVMTSSGYQRIERELERLRTVERRGVAERIRESKQFGEFAENAEYEEAKIEQAFVEGRIRDLRRILQHAQVLDQAEIPTDHIGVGSVVTVVDDELGEEWQFTLVGSVESDPDNDRISDESPIGQALLGKRVGDQVDVAVPDGRIRYTIKSIGK